MIPKTGFNHLSMVKSSTFKDGQIPSLNGWRAVAISLVMLDHARFTVGFPQDRIPNWSRILFEQGNLGVRIFFVLSGFLITHLLLREAERLGSFSRRNFYIRRCLRILPVYFVYLGVLAGLIALKVYGREEASSWLGALTFSRNMVGPVSSYTGHFWSLAVEEQFYLIWPLSLAAFSLWRRPHLAYALLLIPIAICPLVRISSFSPESHGEFYNRVFGGNSILVYADSLAMGCLGAFGIRHISLQRTLTTASLVLALALVVVGFGAYKSNVGARIITLAFIPSFQAAAILVAMLVSTQHANSMAYRVLNWRPVDTLGILSYSLYIWHVIFLCNFGGPSLRALLYNWRSWWLAPLAVAALSYYCVERPILRLKKRLSV